MDTFSLQPPLVYGTAWKEDETERLTLLALVQGFRAIDTANQRKHYHEAGVGAAVAAAIARGLVTREDLWLQTKFTFIGGQDQRLPYDPAAPIAQQVEQSCARSLEHLRTTWIDSYVLHGPNQRSGLGAADWEAWGQMEALQERGLVRALGVSNVSLEQLELLVSRARLKPRFVQNRCFASQGWDRDVRAFCAANGIVYQGFSLLTANRIVLGDSRLADIARSHQKTMAQIVFRFAIDSGMLPLTGTSDPQHMREDLDVVSFRLREAEVRVIERLAG